MKPVSSYHLSWTSEQTLMHVMDLVAVLRKNKAMQQTRITSI